MGGKKSGRKFNPAVRNTPAFAKKKLKVGRMLKRDNATNTTVSAKRIVLAEQLKPTGEQSTSGGSGTAGFQKGWDELVAQLGHYNENICRDAIHGIRTRLREQPVQLQRYLRAVVPGVGSLLIRELKLTATRNQLKRLIDSVCEVPAQVMSSHFVLFVNYILAALTDLRGPVRALSFDVLLLLMKRYAELCRRNGELFHKYLDVMCGERKPTDDRAKLLDSVNQFLVVFGALDSIKRTTLWPERELQISFVSKEAASVCLLPSSAALHFPVLYSADQSTTAGAELPIATRDGLIKCCGVLCPLLEAVIRAEEEAANSARFNLIMSRAFSAVSQLLDISLSFIAETMQSGHLDGDEMELRTQLTDAFARLRKCPMIEGSKKMAQKLEALAAKRQ